MNTRNKYIINNYKYIFIIFYILYYMDNNNIKFFIKDKLDILDKSKSKYKDLLNIKDVIFKIEDKKIIFKKNGEELYTGKYSYLGLFDLKSKIWLWAWCYPELTFNDTIESRQILNYGLQLEPSTNSEVHHYIKSHLINSRLFFENEIFLDIHLGLSLYILKKSKFIYQKNIDNGETQLIIYYVVY